MHDLVIRRGSVVDGTGTPRRAADVAVDAGRVTAIGPDVGAARRTIDADGMIVAPGFVDVHTHYDVQGFWDPYLTPSPFHGVTTVIGGNCGFGVAPLGGDAAAYLMPMLARVEGMPLATLERGVPWDWTSTEDYLARLDGTLALNAGFMVGHSALRRVAMGDAATERAATAAELAQMEERLRAGLRAGGLGFSSSVGTAHIDGDGRPVPSRHAAPDELIALAAVCGEVAGTSVEFNPSIGMREEDIRQLVVDMTVAAQRPLNWNVLIGWAAEREDAFGRLAVSDHARAAGGKVVGLTLAIMDAARLSFLAGAVLDSLDGWGEAMTRPPAEKLALLSDPATRARLAELASTSKTMSVIADWGAKVILETFTDATKRYEGRIVGDIAQEEGKAPFDALVDIAIADDLRTSFAHPRPPITEADWGIREELWRDPRTVIGGSDAGAHLDMMTTFSFTTDLLARGVREQGRLSTEEAVRMLTAEPAALYGLVGRGRLEEGSVADIVVFDETTVAPAPITTRFDLPGGAGRLYADAVGIEHVIVNGDPIVAGRDLTGARPGTLLRSGRDTVTPAMV